MPPVIDLRKEQQATLARPRCEYSAPARALIRSVDALAGKEPTLRKAEVIESLAPAPYRAWESRECRRLTRRYPDLHLGREARVIMRWGREVQDTEFEHLCVVDQKLWEEGDRDPYRLARPLPELAVSVEMVLLAMLARLGVRQAFVLNAELEDSAEHTYAELVERHPEWEEQPATGEPVVEYAGFRLHDRPRAEAANGSEARFKSWADVFRRIMLDERDHRNASFTFAGALEQVVRYEGMLEEFGAEEAA